MDSAVAFAAGVIVGVVLILGLQAVRRLGPVGGSRDDQSSGTGANPVGSVLTRTGTGSFGHGGLHAKLTVTGSRSLIRLDGDQPHVEIDGVTYHRLADVPEHARELLIDELRLVRDTPNLPDAALAGLDAFMAGDDAIDRGPAG
jgi:hypothetical protein